jgi:hypothetical protein
VADNTDLYTFRSPDDPNSITIIANYIPFESPEGEPNYFNFGQMCVMKFILRTKPRRLATTLPIVFTFSSANEDPITFSAFVWTNKT